MLIVGGQLVEGVNQATSVNAAGVVVGTISTVLPNGNVRPNAFRYLPGFAGWFIELLPGPTSTWYSSDAFDVTASREVVGSVFDPIDHSVAHWSMTGDFTDLGLAWANEFVTIAKAWHDPETESSRYASRGRFGVVALEAERRSAEVWAWRRSEAV